MPERRRYGPGWPSGSSAFRTFITGKINTGYAAISESPNGPSPAHRRPVKGLKCAGSTCSGSPGERSPARIRSGRSWSEAAYSTCLCCSGYQAGVQGMNIVAFASQ
jgi:hypothetical protein